jgi:hypothetical protein
VAALRIASSVLGLMRHWRALPANAREAVEVETPAAAATCSRVTGPLAMEWGWGKKLKKALAQSFVQCHIEPSERNCQSIPAARPASFDQ